MAAAAAAAATLALAACGGASSSGPPTQAPTTTAGNQASQTAAPAGTGSNAIASESLHGIVVLYHAAGQPAAQVVAFDPSTGRSGTRTFPDASALMDDNPVPAFVLRQEFNNSFTQVMAQGPQASDGSAAAGVTDTSGHFTPLTASTSGGYGSPVAKAPLAFDPVTGQLWYEYAGQGGSEALGSADPGVGPKSDQSQKAAVPTDTADFGAYFTFTGKTGTGSDTAYFAPGGFGPANWGFDTAEHMLFLPGGKELVVQADLRGASVQLAANGGLDSTTPKLPITNEPAGLNISMSDVTGSPLAAVSPESFITGNEVLAVTQLYLLTIHGGSVTRTALLPPSNRVIQDVVASPDGSTAAFTSTSGEVTTLYTVSLAGTHAVSKVAVLNPPAGDGSHLLAWIP